jgi:hypothetical protein
LTFPLKHDIPLNFSSANPKGSKIVQKNSSFVPGCNKFLHSIAPMCKGVEWLPLYAEYLETDEDEGNVSLCLSSGP